jgi:small subunit ribosomal protein S5
VTIPNRHGVVAHRVIKAACEVIGIKDLEAVVEGSFNTNALVKAFFLGLLRQKTHQILADEKRLHLLELRQENDFFPRIAASPSADTVRTKSEILPNEVLDFELVSFDGHVPHIKPEYKKIQGDIRKTPGWEVGVGKRAPMNHLYEQKIQMLADYGRLQSHLTDLYPECKAYDYSITRSSEVGKDGGDEEEEEEEG